MVSSGICCQDINKNSFNFSKLCIEDSAEWSCWLFTKLSLVVDPKYGAPSDNQTH